MIKRSMPAGTTLADSEITSALKTLPGWILKNNKLHREYRFRDFVHAFGFMATAAMVIEAAGHHPEWQNVYDKVIVDFTTHDVGGITTKDLEMAGKLENLAKQFV